jgi:O-acetyl-ADP-ribose deacetylase (regulator of RNase III)
MGVAVDADVELGGPIVPRLRRPVDHPDAPALDLAHHLHRVARVIGGIAVDDGEGGYVAKLVEDLLILPVSGVPDLVDTLEMAPNLLHQRVQAVSTLGVTNDPESHRHEPDIIRRRRTIGARMVVMAEREFQGGRVRVSRGDITTLEVDAIVNAANQHLAGGGGVDGAIHRAGGPEIMAETRQRFPDGCPTGSAVTTAAGSLPARLVIHAVGPRWEGGGHGEDEQLASAWRAALREAVEHDATSVAFPSLATGIYGFPVRRAAALAMAEVRRALADLPEGRLLEVTVCAFAASDEVVYAEALKALPAD